MKLIIDIPMDAYSMIMDTTFTEDTDRMFLQTPEDRLKTMLLFKTLDSIKNGTPYIEPITIKLSDEDKERFINMMRDPDSFYDALVEADKQEDNENEQ